MRHIGLLGGSFDPPHIGHLIAAQEALWQCRLDQVWLVPTYEPPHQEEKRTSARPEQRLNMVKAAVENHPDFHVCDIEMERGGPSYTYDTVVELNRRYPNDQFYFIIGTDMINNLNKWYKIESLKKAVTFIGLNRPGFKKQGQQDINIINIKMPNIDISSTLIRKRLSKGEPVCYYLKNNVRDYIKGNKLYE